MAAGWARAGLSIQTLSLLPLATVIWYPAPMGRVPLVPIALVVAVPTIILRSRLRVQEDFRAMYATVALFSVLAGATFAQQMLRAVHVNPSTEIYIFGVNAVLGPLIFVLIVGLPNVSGRWLVWGASAASIALLGLGIVLDAGWNVLSFDSQNRLTLPLALNTMPATSVSLVVALLFGSNLATLPLMKSRLERAGTVILLVALIALVYLFASRFAILVIVMSTVWYVLWRAAQRSLLPLVLSVGATVLLGGLVLAGPLSANTRFLDSLASFTLISNPLADTSLAVRVYLWYTALQEIASHPFGIGYMTFVSNTVVADPLLDWRGLNAHNEFLLQTMALGWLPAATLGACGLLLVDTIRRRGELGRMMPLIIAILIAAMFETFSNNPNSINVIPMIWMLLGATVIAAPRRVETSQPEADGDSCLRTKQ